MSLGAAVFLSHSGLCESARKLKVSPYQDVCGEASIAACIFAIVKLCHPSVGSVVYHLKSSCFKMCSIAAMTTHKTLFSILHTSLMPVAVHVSDQRLSGFSERHLESLGRYVFWSFCFVLNYLDLLCFCCVCVWYITYAFLWGVDACT